MNTNTTSSDAQYQKEYPLNIIIIGVLVIVQFFAMIILFVQHYQRRIPNFYGVTPQKNVYYLDALNQPNVTPDPLLRWTTIAATSVFNLDFVNYEETLLKSKQYFTQDGYASFREALDNSNMLRDLTSKQLVITAVSDDSPIILNEGEVNGYYSWKIQVPLILTYQGANTETEKRRIGVTMRVTRVPTTDTASGIGIAQILMGRRVREI